MMLSNLLRFPMMFLGGVFFSVDAMPLPLPYISKALPLTYATEALRAAMSGDITVILLDAIVLVAYMVGTMIVGSKILMKLMTR